jgi:FkbM family methyltransferase
MKDLPANCKVWGERSDVHNFYSCMDLFLFTSRGLHGDMETSPLVLREATGHGMPILMYNLPVYLNQYDGFENIQYLDLDNLKQNLQDIKKILGYETPVKEEKQKKSNFYSQKNINKMFRADFHKDENKIFLYYEDAPYKEVSISVADVDSKHAIYAFDSKFENYSSLWTIPVPAHALNHYNRSGYFRGYEISIYETDRTTLIEKHVVWYNEHAPHFERVLFETDPWNLTWINYTEMFVEDFYNPLAMNIHGVCLDIGANDGLYTEYLLRNGAEKVYAIECDPRSVKFLNKRFHSDERVVVVDKALFSKNEVGMKLAYKNETSTTSSLIDGVHNFDDGQYYEVNAWDYSTLLRKMNIDQVDFFKIDIEGAEYDVFRSMTDFQICHIKAFMVEIHWNRDGRIYEITDRLQSLGYEIQLRRHTEDNAVVENRDEWARYDLCTFYAWKRNDDEELPIVQIVEEDPQDEINIHISHLRTTLNTDVEKQSLENIRGLSEYLMQDSRINFVHLTEFENEPYSDIPPRENCARPNAVSMRAFPNGINEHGQTALTPAHYGCYDAFRKAFLHETEHHSNIGFDLNIFFEGDAYVDDYKLFADCLVDFYRAIDDINNQLAYASFGGIYHLETGELLSERSGQIHGIDWGYFSKHVPFAHCIIIPQWYMVWMREAFRNEPWDVADLFFMNHFRNHPEHRQFVSKSQIARQLNGFSLIDKKVKQYLNK